MVGTNLFEEHDVILFRAMLAFTLTNDLEKVSFFFKSLHLRKKQFQIFSELFLSLMIENNDSIESLIMLLKRLFF